MSFSENGKYREAILEFRNVIALDPKNAEAYYKMGLAAFKLNVYSPYFEHTLSYRTNPLSSPPGGGFSRENIAELVSYARKYHI